MSRLLRDLPNAGDRVGDEVIIWVLLSLLFVEELGFTFYDSLVFPICEEDVRGVV